MTIQLVPSIQGLGFTLPHVPITSASPLQAQTEEQLAGAMILDEIDQGASSSGVVVLLLLLLLIKTSRDFRMGSCLGCVRAVQKIEGTGASGLADEIT